MKTKQLVIILLSLISQCFYAQKEKQLTLDDWKNWYKSDFLQDSIEGISLEKAYKYLEGMESKTVIVGILDGAVDIFHKDLESKIWVNKGEIKNNGIDDDNNGYIDDIHGWNFLGDITCQGYEDERIMNGLGLEENYKIIRNAKQSSKKRIAELQKDIKYDKKTILELKTRHHIFSEYLRNPNYTINDIYAIKSKSFKLKREIKKTRSWVNYTLSDSKYDPTVKPISLDSIGSIINEINVYQDYLKEDSILLSERLHIFDHGKLRQDNICDITDTKYGNNNVSYNIDNDSHATHVSGVIAADRNNHLGISGIVDNCRIMPVRILGDDDECDKDVAFAIKYAVDNGAKVINASFGKKYSPHKEWVIEAIKYAEKNDVLIVLAAGNDNINLDKIHSYPNDSKDLKTEFSNNVIVVGASTPYLSRYLTTSFSNYGAINVDVFAPGYSIYSTIPNNKYAYDTGTSMAAPIVTGIAALVRSYYPNLKAFEVKKIILDSGTSINKQVRIPGHYRKNVKFSELCTSGSVVNAYSAIKMADKISSEYIRKDNVVSCK